MINGCKIKQVQKALVNDEEVKAQEGTSILHKTISNQSLCTERPSYLFPGKTITPWFKHNERAGDFYGGWITGI